MIYEKREHGISVRRMDMPDIRAVCKRDAAVEKQRTVPERGNGAEPFCVRRKTAGRKRLLRLALAVCALFCIFAFDKKVLNGTLSSAISNCAARGMQYMSESAQVVQDNNVTLYTRLVTEQKTENETEVAEETNAVAAPTEDAQTVGEVSSHSVVDGVRYYPITKLDLSAQDIYALSNETSFSPDVSQLASQSPKALNNIDSAAGPLVLILHTHGEECYTACTDMYPENEPTRCTDTDKNVVRVGEEIANTLSDFGIEVIHCTKMHDSESFINAYSFSASSVKEYLKQNPSIRVVVDVHRDAIIRDDGESIAPTTEIAGEEYAQLMFVVGTNELGHNHPDWQNNLSLALHLQKNLDDTYPALCRSINLRNVPFNQQLSDGYLLLEVGTSSNTLEQALRSARAFGENLARAVMMS